MSKLLKENNNTIIEKFVKKHNSNNYKVKFDGNEYFIHLLVGGFEYYCHWCEDSNRIELNDFMVSYKAIIEEIPNNQGNPVFKSKEEYEKMYNDFVESLKSIGVFFYEEKDEEYDSLIAYSLPTNKILNEEFIKEFVQILDNYREKFNEELDFLLGIKYI